MGAREFFEILLVLLNTFYISVLMSSFNRVTLLGNLTRDPELKKTRNGAPVTDLGLALNRVWTGEDGQKQEETTYIDVTVWGRDAENAARFLQKGRSVLIEGRLQMDTWKDQQTGQNRSKLRVVAENLQFLSASQEGGAPSGRNEGRISRQGGFRDRGGRHTAVR